MKSQKVETNYSYKEDGFSNGLRGTTTCGATLQKEMDKKVAPFKSAKLPDLAKLNEQVVKPKNGMANACEAQERRQYAQDAASIVIKAEQEITRINTIEDEGGVLTPETTNQREILKKTIEEILTAGDEILRKQIIFARSLEFIKTATTTAESANEILQGLVSCGRYRAIDKGRDIKDPETGKFLPHLIKYKGVAYEPTFEIKGPQAVVVAVVDQFFYRFYKEQSAQASDKIKEILAGGNNMLAGLDAGKVGVYAIHFPFRKAGDRTWQEGAALVKVCDWYLPEKNGGGAVRVVKILAGAGSQEWLNDLKGKFISFVTFKSGKVDEHLKEPLKSDLEKFIKTLRAGITSWKMNNTKK